MNKKTTLHGVVACPGVAKGAVYKIVDITKFVLPRPGAIILAKFTTPLLASALAVAGGVICETGGVTSHAAIIARELNIPCVVGVAGALAYLSDQQEVILDAKKGIVQCL